MPEDGHCWGNASTLQHANTVVEYTNEFLDDQPERQPSLEVHAVFFTIYWDISINWIQELDGPHVVNMPNRVLQLGQHVYCDNNHSDSEESEPALDETGSEDEHDL